jgi:hypothetical protein
LAAPATTVGSNAALPWQHQQEQQVALATTAFCTTHHSPSQLPIVAWLVNYILLLIKNVLLNL